MTPVVGYMAKRISKNPDWLGTPKSSMYIPSACAFPKTSLTTSTSGNTTATGSSTRPKSFEISRGRTLLNLREQRSSVTKRMRCSTEKLGIPMRQKNRFRQMWFLRLRKHLRASTWSPSEPGIIRNAPRSRATLWRKKFVQMLTVCFPPFMRRKQLSQMEHSSSVNRVRTGFRGVFGILARVSDWLMNSSAELLLFARRNA
jgi:hypothetical protein